MAKARTFQRDFMQVFGTLYKQRSPVIQYGHTCRSSFKNKNLKITSSKDTLLEHPLMYLPSSHESKRLFSQKHSTGSSNQDATKVLYDGECKICEIEISALKRFTKGKGKIEFVDITDSSYDPQNYSGVTYETAMKEMHVINPAGQVLTQGDAIRHMYRACGLGWVAAFTEIPGIKQSCDRLYTWFAVYRLNKALNRCDDGSCSIKLQQLRKQYKKS